MPATDAPVNRPGNGRNQSDPEQGPNPQANRRTNSDSRYDCNRDKREQHIAENLFQLASRPPESLQHQYRADGCESELLRDWPEELSSPASSGQLAPPMARCLRTEPIRLNLLSAVASRRGSTGIRFEHRPLTPESPTHRCRGTPRVLTRTDCLVASTAASRPAQTGLPIECGCSFRLPSKPCAQFG